MNLTKQIGTAIIISTIILLAACGKSEQKIKEEREVIEMQMEEQIITTNEKAVIDLTNKYSSISGWDSLETFTYVLQEMFIDEKKVISFKGELKDLYKSDSTYFISVHNTGWHSNRNYIAIISLTSEKFAEIKKQLNSTNHTDIGCFIFNVSKISSTSPEIRTEVESESENPYSYLTYDFEETLLIFKGELIDFYLNEVVVSNYE